MASKPYQTGLSQTNPCFHPSARKEYKKMRSSIRFWWSIIDRQPTARSGCGLSVNNRPPQSDTWSHFFVFFPRWRVKTWNSLVFIYCSFTLILQKWCILKKKHTVEIAIWKTPYSLFHTHTHTDSLTRIYGLITFSSCLIKSLVQLRIWLRILLATVQAGMLIWWSRPSQVSMAVPSILAKSNET